MEEKILKRTVNVSSREVVLGLMFSVAPLAAACKNFEKSHFGLILINFYFHILGANCKIENCFLSSLTKY